jgi:transposase InsO family protein
VAFPIRALCEVMQVSRSGFYAWHDERDGVRSREDRELADRIRDIHHRSRCTYGVRRIRAELRSQGLEVGLRRVRKLMRQQGLVPRSKRRFRATTDSRHSFPIAANVLGRDFEQTAPNQAWVGDITYIPTDEGWLYLATLIDLFSRRVVGWAMSDRIDRKLTLTALEKAVADRAPAAGLIHHTDRGSQYACGDYRAALQASGMICSMSRKGDPWDNAVAESAFATLKADLVDGEHYRTRAEAIESISRYLEEFYNRSRRHSTLGYLSPVEFELAHDAQIMAA